MRIVYILVGIVLFPIFWLLGRLGVVKPPAQLPKEIEALVAHFERNGLVGSFQVLPPVDHANSTITLKYGLNPNKFLAVTITSSPTAEAASQIEAEAAGAPQYTGVRRNGKYVVACTFSPPDPEFEQRLAAAFMSYRDGV